MMIKKKKRAVGSQRLVLLLLISAFSPYLMGLPIHLDQVVAYTLAPVMFALSLLVPFRSRAVPIYVYTAVFGLFAAVAVVITQVQNPGAEQGALFWGNLDNVTKCFAWGLFGCGIMARGEGFDEEHVRRIFLVLIVVIGANGAIALSAIFWDLSAVLQYFRPASETATWIKVFNYGRLLGTFHAPSQAGAIYSLGFLTALFYLSHYRARRLLAVVATILIFAGGVMSLSKAFLFVGLPMGAIYFIITGRLWLQALKYSLLVLPLGATIVWLAAEHWWGARLLVFYLGQPFEGDFIASITGNRFGAEGSSTDLLWQEVLSDAPMLGFGMGTINPIDGGWLMFYVQGGVIGLLLFAGLYGVLAWYAVGQQLHPAVRRYFQAVLLLTFVLEVATPILTRNIYSTIFFCVLLTVVNWVPPAARLVTHGVPDDHFQGRGHRENRPRT